MPDWILAFSTVIGAGIYLRATLNLPQLLIGDAVGPQFFPALVGLGLLVSGLLLTYEAWRKQTAAVGMPHRAPVQGAKKAQTILIAMAAWTALYYAAFEPIGYIASTIIYLFALLSYFNRVKWWFNAIYTLCFTAVAYLVFARFLHVVLPSGILPI